MVPEFQLNSERSACLTAQPSIAALSSMVKRPGACSVRNTLGNWRLLICTRNVPYGTGFRTVVKVRSHVFGPIFTRLFVQRKQGQQGWLTNSTSGEPCGKSINDISVTTHLLSRRPLSSTLLAAILALGMNTFEISLTSHAADWPQWRGPKRNGVSAETGLLKEWPKEGPKLLWKITDAGSGYAAPAIAGDRVFFLGN